MKRELKKISGLIWILFLMTHLDGSAQLQFYTDVYAWYPDGKVKKISPGDGIYFQPCIHPQGTHVTYYGNSSGPPRVWKANLSTGEIVALTAADTNARHPVFDWKGERIVFSSDHGFDQKHETVEEMTPSGEPPPNAHFNIFIMDADGQNKKQITEGLYQDERPCFSPDGKHITFVSNRHGIKNGLWSVSIDGSSDPQALLQKGWGYRPWYSVDGQWIFFYTDVNERHHICKVPAEGGKKIPLENDTLRLSHGPFADPDGTCLLVHGIKEGNWHGIWEIPLNGDPPKNLKPPGFDTIHHGHATRSMNGVITFDALRPQQTASTVEPPRTVDRSFHYPIKSPAYPEGKGPVVLIDEAHNNFHTAVGTYLPFADLLRQDGFVVKRAEERISEDLLSSGAVYVIADAQPPARRGDPPTFSKQEIKILNGWVKKGGSLFVITDHMPDPGAIKELALSFGIEVSNGYVMEGPPPGSPGPTLFRKSDGSLADHPLTKGRNEDEEVRRVATFAGSAFRCDEGFQPLLILGEGFRSWIPEEYNKFPPGTPNIDVAGWYQGGVKIDGEGKIAFFAEAAMFTAQIFSEGRMKAGMNHLFGRDNARFLLNILHWLSGITDS
jgi:Tol biopolymer transport system component